MIQAIGLTSMSRRRRPPRVDDLTFEASPGKVTVLLGPAGSGKSEALRLMLQLVPGRGIALFRGRPLHRIPHPAHEVGVLLGDVPGHPGRTARGHLRMLAAVVGAPQGRVDDVLDLVGLTGLADQRLGDFSRGMDRRLGMAAALLGDPHTLVLDEPTKDLSPREASWLHGLLRGFVHQGGQVLTTTCDPKEAARTGDRIVSLERGRLMADQLASDFRRTRLRPRVAIRTPHAERFAAVLSQEARSAARSRGGGGAIEVVCEGGSRVEVYGSNCAAVGETAYRHGILVHQLAEEIGDTGDRARRGPLLRADGRIPVEPAPAHLLAGGPASEREAHALPGAAPVHGEVQHAAPQPDVEPRELAGTVLVESQKAVGAGDRAGARGEARGAAAEAEDAAVETANSGSTAQGPSVPAPSAHVSEPTAPHGTESTEEAEARPEACIDAEAAEDDPAREPGEPPHEPSAGTTKSLVQVADAVAVRSPRPAVVSAPPVTSHSAEPAELGSGSGAAGRWAPEAPELPVVRRPGPAAPVRYELRRMFGVRTPWLIALASVLASLMTAVVLARQGATGAASHSEGLLLGLRLLTGWPDLPFLLPPAAPAAGLLGALAFGQEFRYPALAPAQAPVPRRLGLLAAKLLVSGAVAIGLCLVTAMLNVGVLTLLYGLDSGAFRLPAHGFGLSSLTQLSVPTGDTAVLSPGLQALSVLALCVGCAWAGLLAAGVFRSTFVGVVAALGAPLLVAPLAKMLSTGPVAQSLDGFPARLRTVLLFPWPSGAEQWVAIAMRLTSQPLGRALALSLTVLFCVYAFTSLRSRPR